MEEVAQPEVKPDAASALVEEAFEGRFAVTKDLRWLLTWDVVGQCWMNEYLVPYPQTEVIVFPTDCRTPSAAKQTIASMRIDAKGRAHDDALKLLEQPDLWNIADQEIGVRVKEDSDGRQAAFAIMLTGFLPKPAHLMLLGSTAIGKTWLAKSCSAFLPPESVIVLGSSTERAWFYFGDPVYKPHPVIPKKEIIDYYRIDWRNKIVIILDNVRPDTVKDLKPIMSHDSPEIDLQTTERTQGGRFRTRRVKTIGCPAFINCSTWLQWDAELTSRHYYLTPKDTQEKFQAAADLLDQEYLTGSAPTSAMIPIIQDAIRYLISRELSVVIHPSVIAKLRENFTWTSGRDVRDYERAATIIQAIAWFHALQRERNEHCAVIADERDLQIAEKFLPTLLRTSHYGTSSQVLDYYERVLKPLADSGELHEGQPILRDLSQNEIRSKYTNVYHRTITRFDLYEYNKVLESLNLIELIKDPEDKRRRLVRLTRTDPQKRLP